MDSVPAGEPMRILVAEDDKKVASFIQKGLQQEGHAADVVHDGKDASHQVLNFEYDIVADGACVWVAEAGVDVRAMRLFKEGY